MDNKQKNVKNAVAKITLPWLIVTIASIIAFMAFIIAMFFEFHASIFFGVFVLIIAVAVLLDGIQKKKENYLSGNLNYIMAALCVICAVVFMKE